MKAKIMTALAAALGLFGVLGIYSPHSDSGAVTNWNSVSSAIAKPMLRAHNPMDTATAWAGMTHGQRMEYMKKVVFPKMKAEFVAFDSVRFGSMDCRTCHGNAANDGSFKMPNPEIWKMPKDMKGWGTVQKNNPNYMHFMMMKVKPEMAALLGETPSNPEEHIQGFGCNNCHTGE